MNQTNHSEPVEPDSVEMLVALAALASNQIKAIRTNPNQLKVKNATPPAPHHLVSSAPRSRRPRRGADFFATINALLGWNRHPRNGKVARLPEETRNQINRMLEDGVPYRAIVAHLQHSEPPLPYPVSEMNISNWRHGGYQEWRQQQEDALVASLSGRTG
jgi:hypothetical protein